MKFAHAKAETKSHIKTIRELAYMETGYKAEDLQEGRLIFAKVRRSREILRMETAARLSAMSKGLTIEDKTAPTPQTALFGEIEDHTAPAPVVEDADFEPIQVSKRDQLITTLEYYLEKGLVKPDMAGTVGKMVTWTKATTDAETSKHWAGAIDNLKKLESTIPAEGKLTHDLY
jgi:hypothetical protein